MNDPAAILGTDMRRRRKRLGYSRVKFAAMLGVNVEHVDAWETGGIIVPTSAFLRASMLGLGCGVEEASRTAEPMAPITEQYVRVPLSFKVTACA